MNEEQEKQLKEWGVKLPKEKKQFNITHLIVAGFIGSLITGMVLTLIIVAGLSNSLITDGQCDDIIQMRLENESETFYLQGVYETSQWVLSTGTLPVFTEGGKIEYINLTKLQEDK